MKKKIFYIIMAVLSVLLVFAFTAGAENTENEADLQGFEFSVAQNSLVCPARGDVNFDGEITPADARLILRFAVELQTPSSKEFSVSNLDDDSSVTVTDARLALRIAVGLDEGIPHDSTEQVIIKEATCYDIGRCATKCAYCGNVFDLGVIPQKQHTGAGWDITEEATCTKTGLKEMRCVYCDTLMKTEETPPGDHIFGEMKYIGDNDCTKMRKAYRECKNCGYTEDFILLPTAHSYVWTVTTEPTCTEYGIEEMACKYCGRVMPDSEQHILSFLGHIGNWTVVQYPTVTEDGLKINICMRCGEELEREVLPKTGSDIIEEE